jgi:phage repressor protein C with HTH and peptisase S24 domain
MQRMDKWDRLKFAREAAGFRSAAEAARRLSVPYGTYAGHENGSRGIKDGELESYAKAFKVSLTWLAFGEGDQQKANVARVMGYVGAGAEIEPDFEQVPDEGLYEIELPFPIPPDAVAFEVRGDSMWPRYDDGDVVVCWRFSLGFDKVIGWEAAVRTADGRRFLKRIVYGDQRGTFNLESYNAPPIRGVHLEWVGQVNAVVRRGEWKQADARSASRRIKAAMARTNHIGAKSNRPPD